MTPDLVSIIMPAFNGEMYIKEAITSVIAQSYQVWELIVVDDGSTDHTADIVATFNDPRIHYTYQENQGQAAALNHGLKLVQGNYITTLDVDDWLSPNSLLDRIKFMEQNSEYGAVYGNGYYCTATGKLLRRFDEYSLHDVTGDLYDILINSNFATGATVMIRRQILDHYQLRYDEMIVWCQDWDFYVRLAEKKIEFGYVEAITVYYRMHSDNMTQVMPAGRRRESSIRTRHKILNSPRFAKVGLSSQTKFFYSFLDILRGQVADQTAIINSAMFKSLPSKAQAELIRLIALDYMVAGKHNEEVRNWLRNAWALDPLGIKTLGVIGLSIFNLDLARKVAIAWRKTKHSNKRAISPFEMASRET